ncbi:hypothetical protein EW093_09675 [Thiospirochaeta perfilievii]|uniref:Uncharacterized protein n=1 Tax=Thiospirochaeta perfilievii TaxID=252967 RepID=A0A5C1QA69_9SPIO|nr:hypothetical protein [Thiospirochaeta perfilievii]QEN04965.1 hypothetical protein EW093_09675 [Thiospirochaeta perfilievii]
MGSRVVYLLILLLFTTSIFSIDLGLSGGFSRLSYVEVGINNKEDEYIFNSLLGGLEINSTLNSFIVNTSVSVQVPYDLQFNDALGRDEFNYLSGLFFFGGNVNLGLLYPFIINSTTDLQIGPVLSYDIIFLRDNVIGYSDEYLFSVLGSGLEFKFIKNLSDCLDLSINLDWVINFLPINSRSGEYKWSYNFLTTIGFLYKI